MSHKCLVLWTESVDKAAVPSKCVQRSLSSSDCLYAGLALPPHSWPGNLTSTTFVEIPSAETIQRSQSTERSSCRQQLIRHAALLHYHFFTPSGLTWVVMDDKSYFPFHNNQHPGNNGLHTRRNKFSYVPIQNQLQGQAKFQMKLIASVAISDGNIEESAQNLPKIARACDWRLPKAHVLCQKEPVKDSWCWCPLSDFTICLCCWSTKLSEKW